MSTRKVSAAVAIKTDSGGSSAIPDETKKIETNITMATSPTQKDATKSTSGNSRVTRNSPLLTPPTIKKEHHSADSEPANSESEDCSGATGGGNNSKKQIRGRKSIKEVNTTTIAKEEPSKSAEECKELKETEKAENKENEKNETHEKEEGIVSKESQEKEVEDHKENNENETEDSKTSKEEEVKDLKRTEIKDCKEKKDKDTTDSKDNIEKVSRDLEECREKDVKDSKDTKEKDSKETKDTKDSKESKESKETVTTSNRLTRHAVAQEVASKTRITRNRQSSGATARSETPPAVRRRRPAAVVRKMPEASTSQKRKRSIEEPVENPISKIIKLEPKDSANEATEDEEMAATLPTSTSDLGGLKIKQELIESDDGNSMTTDANTSAATTATTSSTVRGRGGGRWAGRKPTKTASPSTRSTRQTKGASPASSISSTSSSTTERKRRRTAGGGDATISRSASTSLIKTTGAQATNAAPDEDSKDSMASSMDDILLTDIKVEKLTPELDENHDVEMEEKKTMEEDFGKHAPDEEKPLESHAANGVAEPLTVKTGSGAVSALTNVVSKEIITATEPEASTSATTSNEDASKAASLSPELVSEGVSEISVKKFYNKPEFLENNLGIEEDPKLGEIVQKASTEVDNVTSDKESTPLKADESVKGADNWNEDGAQEADVENTNAHDESFSTESLKEGELVYEESTDGKQTPVNDEISSIDTSQISIPLVKDNTETTAQDVTVTDTKDEGELLEERLVIDEEDLDDDDLTVEESETISMDNNPSLHEDAAEEEQEVEDDVNDDLADEIEDLVGNSGLTDGVVDAETKETSNECDIEKAKLQVEKSNGENKEEEKPENSEENEVNTGTNAEEEHSKVAEETQEGNFKRQIEDEPEEISKKSKDDEQKQITNEKDVIEQIEEPQLHSDEKKIKLEFGESDTNKKALKKDEADADIKVNSAEESKLSTSKKLEDKVKQEAAIAENLSAELESNAMDSNAMDVDKNTTEKMEVDDEEEQQKAILLSEEIEKLEKPISRPMTPNKELDGVNASQQNSPAKSTKSNLRDSKDEDANSIKSTQSTDANSWATLDLDNDDEEKLRQKEQHLQNLGLLTHEAAEKRRQEYIQSAAAVEASRAAGHHQQHSKRNGSKSSSANATTHEYTGTLKTVIKLNRSTSGATGAAAMLTATASTSNGSNGRKSQPTTAIGHSKDGVRRQSLKITFQKGRGRGHHLTHTLDRHTYSGAHGAGPHSHSEDSYYTIQNENEGAHKTAGGSSTATATVGVKDQQLQKQHNNNNNNNNTPNVQTHGRKTYNSRSNTTTSYNHHHFQNNLHSTTSSAHIDSSHSEGQSELTTHHGAAHTSVGITSHKKDDKEEILIPEKASSFKFHPGRLCEDQCYYCSGKFGLYDTPCHVAQIKSLERQQKILQNEEKLTVDNCLCDACFRHVDRRANVPSYKKRLSAPGQLQNTNTVGHAEDGGAVEETDTPRKCVVPDCGNLAPHSLRRKCIRKSVKKFLLNFEMPTGSPYIWLCQSHYDAVIQCSGCVLCKRRLGKNHMYHITSDTDRLEKALTDMGIPVQLGIGTAVCKLCRYFANLLMKPPDSTKSQKAEFVKNYRKRLLQFHNIHEDSNEVSEVDEEDSNGNNTAATTNDTAANKNKTSQKRLKLSKEQRNTSSPTASSNSSVICMAEVSAEQAAGEADNSGQQSLIDNETLADYEMPTMSAQNSGGDTSNDSSKSTTPTPVADGGKQSSRLKAILQSGNKQKPAATNDLSCALLRSNPNLSMRELFPGEEDLGLHFKAPFGSSNSQRTPEGWTRVQTFLQYDEPTRRLWEELQKPYGNQSSFLRHLILLEKYYRNGELVLSANASSNASVYTQTVRQRLTSYDQGHCGGLVTETLNETSSSPAATAKNNPSDIPFVEINDDDDDNQRDTARKIDGGADQAEVTIQNTSTENSAAKRRTRSVSVDKLTKQLSTNSVTIIARPKEGAHAAATSASKQQPININEVTPQKRMESSKTHAANAQSSSPAASSIPPLSAVSTATTPTNNPIGSIASSSNNSNNSRSILKANLLGIASNKSVEILPIATHKSNATSNTVSATTVNIPSVLPEGSTKQQKILDVANKLLGSQMEAAAAAAKQQHAALLTSPPELVSLQRRSSSNAATTNTITTSTSSSSSSTAPSASSTTASLINAKRPHLMNSRQAGLNRGVGPPNVVILPETLSSHERAESKSWRPTLMSVEENQHLLNKSGPLYQTADGRRLPGLVQVQSGGKPFLISIFDYNRMCILRREKLMRDQMLKAGKHGKSHQQNQHQRNMQHPPNYSKMNASTSGSSMASKAHQQAQAAVAQQQLLQLLQLQKQQQTAALKAAAASNAAAGNNRYAPIAPKPSLVAGNSISNANMLPSNSGNNSGNSMPNNSGTGRLSANQPNFPMPLLANALSNATAAAASGSSSIGAAAASLNNPWLWSNFPDAHELLRNGTQANSSKLPPLLPKPTMSSLPPTSTVTSKQLQQQLLLDNTLMSKIPKSLTVIPQHKLMGNSSSNTMSKE